MRHVVLVVPRFHGGQPVADHAFQANAGHDEGVGDHFTLALGRYVLAAFLHQFGCSHIGCFVPEQFARGRVLQWLGIAKHAKNRVRAVDTQHIGRLAPRQHHTPFLGGDDAWGVLEEVPVKDHGLIEERVDEVEWNRRDGRTGELRRAHLGR